MDKKCICISGLGISVWLKHPVCFLAEQEDPRLRIPVQQRRRGSLDPNDLGPLPVCSLIILSLPSCLSEAHRFSFKN